MFKCMGSVSNGGAKHFDDEKEEEEEDETNENAKTMRFQ